MCSVLGRSSTLFLGKWYYVNIKEKKITIRIGFALGGNDPNPRLSVHFASTSHIMHAFKNDPMEK